jgi:nitrile hydratase subunit alpha
MSAAHGQGPHETAPEARLEKRLTAEQTQALEARVQALESLLVTKGLVSSETLDKVATTYESDLGPMNGAKVIARAWVDPAYKQRLLTNATAAIAELGFSGLQGEHMVLSYGEIWPALTRSTTWSSKVALSVASVSTIRCLSCFRSS